jgi:outer membrane protein
MKFKFFKKIFLVLLLPAVFLFGQQSDSTNITVDQAVQLTLKNYPLIKETEQAVKISKAKESESESQLYPDIEAEASYNRIGPNSSIEFGGAEFNLAPLNNYDVDVSLRHKLYDFGKRDAVIDLAKSFEQSAEDKVELIKKNLSFQTIQTFYGILFIEKSITVKDTDLSVLNHHLKEIQIKVDNGTATDYDIYSTQVRIADVKNQKIDLVNQMKDLEISFKRLTGIPYNREIKLIGNFSYSSKEYSTDSLLTKAYTQRPEIQLAKDAEQSAKLQLNSAKLGDMPNVNLQLSYGLRNGFMPDLDAIRGNWLAGVSVQVPIFNGFITKNKESEAETELESSQIKIEDEKDQVHSEIAKALSNLSSESDKIDNAKVQVDYAEKSLQKADAQYRSGTATNLDMLDADAKLAQARLMYLQVLYNNIIDQYYLKQAVGEKVW